MDHSRLELVTKQQVRACWRTDQAFAGAAVARMKKIMVVGGVSRRA
jgi:hypothetical protein